MLLGTRIKELRESKNLLQRQLAAELEIDTPMYSKIERGERIAKREYIILLANLLDAEPKELLSIWLADKILLTIENEDFQTEAINIALKTLNK